MQITTIARRGLALMTLAIAAVVLVPTHGAAQEPQESRPCTAIVTPTVSALRFGSELGLAAGPAIVPGLVGTGLALSGDPELSGQIQAVLNDTVYQQIFDRAGELRSLTADQLNAVDDLLAPLGSNNESVDRGIEQSASVLEQISDIYGDRIAPADRTLVDVVAVSRYFSSGTCRE